MKRKFPILPGVSIGVGTLALLYYLLAGLVGGFGTSVLWIWPAGGGFCLLLGCLDLFLYRRGRRVRWIPLGGYILIGLCLIPFIAVEAQVIEHMNDRAPADSDVILVLGAQVKGEAPGIALSERIETAYVYLRDNPETKAVLCGGQGPGEDITEAECMFRALTARGIEETRLMREDRSTSTAENVRFARQLCPEAESAVVVSSHFHIYRAIRLAESCGFTNVRGEAAPFSLILTPHYMAREFMTVVEDTRRGNLQ